MLIFSEEFYEIFFIRYLLKFINTNSENNIKNNL